MARYPGPEQAFRHALVTFFALGALGALGGMFGGRDSLPDAVPTAGGRLPFGVAVEPVHLIGLVATTVVVTTAALFFRWG